MRIKLVIAYDGTEFSGWQVQLAERTVQGEINRALSLMLDTPIMIMGAGRTDKGVHATGQVAHFEVDNPRVPIDRILRAVKRRLPRDIKIISVEEVANDFHACFSATRRVYRYRFVAGEMLPHQRFYYAPLPFKIELKKMQTFLTLFEGEKDFTTFSLKDSTVKTRVRNIKRFEIVESELGFDLLIEAGGFLRKMVRMVVGSVLSVYESGNAEERILKMIAARDNFFSGPPAFPGALYLEKVYY